MDLLAAIILIAVGAAALFVGFRLWLILLPIFGFFVGFVVGAELISTWLGDGFLQNVLGIVVGAVTAVIFAFLAIFWWWAGVVLVLAGFGFVVAAVVLRLPRALVIVASSLWGSGAVLAGVLVILNRIDVEELGFGAVNQAIGESFFWFIAWLALAVVGMAAQAFTSDPVSLVPDDAGGWSSRSSSSSGMSGGTP
jgi:hypothetical protein